MGDDVYFDGDPAVDSRRRHLERVIKGHPPRRRWPWVVAAVAGGGVWALWRALQPRQPQSAEKPGAPEHGAQPDRGTAERR